MCYRLFTLREKESLTLSRVRKYLLAREQACVPKCLIVFVNIYVISRDWFIRGIAPTGQLEIYISSRIFPLAPEQRSL